MKFSSLIAYSILVSTAVAVYPPPTDLDNSNTDDSVTIQSLNGDVAEVPSNNHHTSSNLNSEIDSNHLLSSSSSKSSSSTSSDSETLSPFYSFYLAISMIVVSEIGDKTFLIAAIMAMRYPRMVVFSAASSALVLMTILSGAIGHILPQLLSPTLTRAAASILFLVFGVNLLREGLSVDKNQGVEEELAEVEEEIAAVELNELTEDIEKGKTQIQHTWTSRIKNLVSYVSSPIWFQTFSMTFLGEWGDRSQITTIAMAAGADWISIVLGGTVGHVACTLMAVLGGQYISTKISLRTILLGGSFAFFIFSGLYCYSAIYE